MLQFSDIDDEDEVGLCQIGCLAKEPKFDIRDTIYLIKYIK